MVPTTILNEHSVCRPSEANLSFASGENVCIISSGGLPSTFPAVDVRSASHHRMTRWARRHGCPGHHLDASQQHRNRARSTRRPPPSSCISPLSRLLGMALTLRPNSRGLTCRANAYASLTCNTEFRTSGASCFFHKNDVPRHLGCAIVTFSLAVEETGASECRKRSWPGACTGAKGNDIGGLRGIVDMEHEGAMAHADGGALQHIADWPNKIKEES